MTRNIIYLLIYWAVSGAILVHKILDGVEKPKVKDWLPTFILAPLIFPFFMAINSPRYNDAIGGYFGTGRKKKEEQKQKQKKQKQEMHQRGATT